MLIFTCKKGFACAPSEAPTRVARKISHRENLLIWPPHRQGSPPLAGFLTRCVV